MPLHALGSEALAINALCKSAVFLFNPLHTVLIVAPGNVVMSVPPVKIADGDPSLTAAEKRRLTDLGIAIPGQQHDAEATAKEKQDNAEAKSKEKELAPRAEAVVQSNEGEGIH